MLCLTCHRPAGGPLCVKCRGSLRRAPTRLLPPGLAVVAAYEHEGVGRELVHLLKYRGVTVVADLVADELASRLPDLPLVPVPRVMSRRLRYGIDPALEVASAIAALTGRPVLRSLAAPLHSRRRAGHNRTRPAGPYHVVGVDPGEVVLVDDVLTTGGTITAAMHSLGVSRVRAAATASAVSGLSNLHHRVTSPTTGRV